MGTYWHKASSLQYHRDVIFSKLITHSHLCWSPSWLFRWRACWRFRWSSRWALCRQWIATVTCATSNRCRQSCILIRVTKITIPVLGIPQAIIRNTLAIIISSKVFATRDGWSRSRIPIRYRPVDELESFTDTRVNY